MAEIRAATYEDKEYGSCGSTTIAVLEIDQITIPLCRDCAQKLIESIDIFNNTTFCYQCDHFIMSNSGWRYGGSCKLKASKDGKEITEKDAGFNYCTDCMKTCKDAVRKGEL